MRTPDELWESAMRASLKEDVRYQDPEALDRRIELLKRRRQVKDVNVYADETEKEEG